MKCWFQKQHKQGKWEKMQTWDKYKPDEEKQTQSAPFQVHFGVSQRKN